MGCAASGPVSVVTPPRPPEVPPPASQDEALKSSAIDAGIDFTGKDSHCTPHAPPILVTVAQPLTTSFRIDASAGPDVRTRKSGMLDRTTALIAYQNMPAFVHKLPKAELHVHLEGTITPQRVRAIAERNKLTNLDAFDPAKDAVARQGYREGAEILEYCKGENALNAFLTQYNKNSGVYRTAEDFYDVMMDYLKRAAANGVVRAEIFFDPQTHCYEDVSGCAADPATRDPHGVGKPKLPIKTVLDGLCGAIDDARKTLGIDAALILSFLQDRSTEEADAVLEQALPFKDKILGVDQDNGTGPFGPGSTSRFKDVYMKAKANGIRLTAHAGEEEGAKNVAMCLDTLQCERINHGVRSLEDAAVVARLAKDRVPLTCCPLSNHRMQLYPRFFCGENPIRPLLEAGVMVTINSDDPAYFNLGDIDAKCLPCNDQTYDGFIASNYLWTARSCGLTPDECVIIARNSLEATFVPDATKAEYLETLRKYCDGWRPPAV